MATEATDVLAGPVLEVLPKLLAEGRIDEALEVVRALVVRNEELEQQLAGLGRRTMKANEGVSSDQLRLFLDALNQQRAQAEGDHDALTPKEQDELLQQRAEAAAERARQKALAEADKPKRRALKKKLPAALERRDNLIKVPEAERACPKCGEEREVIGHEISEVAEAIDQILASRIMHFDGSGLDVLNRAHPNGKQRGAIWGMAGASSTKPEVAAYVYASTKKAKGQRPGELGPSDILAPRSRTSRALSIFPRGWSRMRRRVLTRATMLRSWTPPELARAPGSLR
jgi:hypothetical protein